MDNALEKLKEYIGEEAARQAEALTEEAERQAQHAYEEALLQTQQTFAGQKEQFARQSRRRVEDAVRHKSVLLRRERTLYAAGLIDELFSHVEESLCAMPGEEFLDFYGQAVDGLGLTGEAEVVLGERSAQSLTDEQRRLLTRRSGGCATVVSETVIPGQGGFLLRQQPVEYSFLFADLLEEIKTQQSPGLLKRLLDD